MSAMVLPAPDGTFMVWCNSCPREIAVATETAAELEADKHDKADARWQATMERVHDVAAAVAARDPLDTGHRHGPQCTREVCDVETYSCERLCTHVGTAGEPCQGHRVPSRVELVERSRKRYRK